MQLLDRVHGITDRLYAALAIHLGPDPAAARQQAFAVHSSVLGLALMAGLAEGLDDPLKHDQQALVEALVARMFP
jgi:hypothetical protein